MAKLSTCEVEAGVNLIVDDDTAANTSTECDHNGVLGALSNTCNGLSLSSSISIVFDENSLVCTESCGELGLHIIVAEGEIVCVNDLTGFAVCSTGSCDTDRADIVHSKACLVNDLSAKSGNISSDIVSASVRRNVSGSGALLDYFIIFIDDTSCNVSTAEVDADVEHSLDQTFLTYYFFNYK